MVHRIVSCFGKDEEYRIYNIIEGIAGALISCLLIFGAFKRSSTAILVWMILSVIEIIGSTICGILLVMVLAFADIDKQWTAT